MLGGCSDTHEHPQGKVGSSVSAEHGNGCGFPELRAGLRQNPAPNRAKDVHGVKFSKVAVTWPPRLAGASASEEEKGVPTRQEPDSGHLLRAAFCLGCS